MVDAYYESSSASAEPARQLCTNTRSQSIMDLDAIYICFRTCSNSSEKRSSIPQFDVLEVGNIRESLSLPHMWGLRYRCSLRLNVFFKFFHDHQRSDLVARYFTRPFTEPVTLHSRARITELGLGTHMYTPRNSPRELLGEVL